MGNKNSQVDPSIYNSDYYQEHSVGFTRMRKLLGDNLEFTDKKVLDIGCGSGDLAIYLAKKGNFVTGIDYSKDGIVLANKKKSKLNKSLQKRLTFVHAKAEDYPYPKNHFDVAVSIDFFEHINHKDLKKTLQILNKSLKPTGKLIVHTEPNKIYLDFTHKFYIYPISQALLWINNKITHHRYPGLPKDPRNKHHKEQHINEPTYGYLKKLFRNTNFSSNITCFNIAKPNLSWKDTLYNLIVVLHPISLYWPLNRLFAYDYLCIANKKS